MNYLGMSCLETVHGKLLDARVDSLEAATSNIQKPVGAGQTHFVGGVSAGSMIAPNLLGPMLTFSGNPPNESPIQYLNMSGTINNTFRSSLYEGVDDFFLSIISLSLRITDQFLTFHGPGHPGGQDTL